MPIPSTQSELIRTVRGDRSQVEFARTLGVDRSCLSRYEREVLGAPPSVINYCLAEIRRLHLAGQGERQPITDALKRAREVVIALERLGEPTKRGSENQANRKGMT